MELIDWSTHADDITFFCNAQPYWSHLNEQNLCLFRLAKVCINTQTKEPSLRLNNEEMPL